MNLTEMNFSPVMVMSLETRIIVPFAAGMSHARPIRAKCKSGGFTHGWARG